MPSERNQTQKVTNYTIHLIQNDQNRQIHRRKQTGGYQELGGRGEWRMIT